LKEGPLVKVAENLKERSSGVRVHSFLYHFWFCHDLSTVLLTNFQMHF
jgi:hypothetical protein